MSMNTVSEENVVEWIAELLRADFEAASDGYVFTGGACGDLKLQVQSSRIHSVLSILANKQEQNETTLFDGRSYESLVREESRFGLPLLRRERNEVIRGPRQWNGL